MKLENQVCTLEQAKRLKELGVEQKSLFNWSDNSKPTDVESFCIEYQTYTKSCGWKAITNHYSAFTVAELGAMLPVKVKAVFPKDTENSFEVCFYIEMHDYMVAYENHGLHHSNGTLHQTQESTEAQARAAMLIYLLENNLTTAEEVNQRLTN